MLPMDALKHFERSVKILVSLTIFIFIANGGTKKLVQLIEKFCKYAGNLIFIKNYATMNNAVTPFLDFE